MTWSSPPRSTRRWGPPMADLFAQLCAHYNVQPDRRGEAHVDCPWCGKEAKRGQTHFSFSERGAHCWVCGKGSSLAKFAQMVAGIEPVEYVARPKPRERRRGWQVTEHGQEMFARYEAHKSRWHLWSDYAPSLETETIVNAHLGIGSFPKYASKCQHNRLQVPLLCVGRVVGFRARAIECDCPKWLGPAGNPAKFLYNGAAIEDEAYGRKVEDRCYIGDCHMSGVGGAVWIVENPIDALLLAQESMYAVATLGVTMWHDAWTEMIRDSGMVAIVAYDNDAPGNGGGNAGRADWIEKHPKAGPPQNGRKLVQRLKQGGCAAMLFDWENDPLKADIGDLLRRPE